MGGPQVNITQMMAAGQADCVMGSSDLQMVQMREGGVPVTTVAAVFQKDPQVLIAHEDVKRFEDLKGKTILIAASAQRGYWPWLKAKYGFTDSQTRPYTFNIQPFRGGQEFGPARLSDVRALCDSAKAGVKANTLMFSDQGFPAYATTISCMDKTVKERSKAPCRPRSSPPPWKAGRAIWPIPAPGQCPDQERQPQHDRRTAGLQRGQAQGNEYGRRAAMPPGMGIGVMTDARVKASYDFLVERQADRSGQGQAGRCTYNTEPRFKDIKVLP